MPTSGGYQIPGQAACPGPMTRAALLALRTAGTLDPQCHYIIIDGPTIGTAGNTSVTQIELHAVSATELSLSASVDTSFDNSSWIGTYDIDSNSIIRLTDSSNNVVVDTDATAPTVHTQFPWHLGSALGVGTMRDNYIEDSILTGWATQVGTISDNRITGSTVNLTGKTAGTINGSVFIVSNITSGPSSFQVSRHRVNNSTINGTSNTGVIQLFEGEHNQCTITTGNAQYATARSSFRLHTYTQTGTGSLVTFNDCDVYNYNVSRAGTGTMTINSSRFGGGGAVTQSAAAGNMQLEDVDVVFSNFTANGSGQLTAFRCNILSSNINTAGGSTRSLQIQESEIVASTINEQRTLNANFDVITESLIRGGSVVTSTGAAGGAANTSILDGTTVEAQSTVTITDPPSGVDVGNCLINLQSTLNVQAGGFINRSRISNQSTTNTGAFGHDQVIIDYPGVTTLTAANTNRLKNKAFNDTI